jgi:hypothetical protein
MSWIRVEIPRLEYSYLATIIQGYLKHVRIAQFSVGVYVHESIVFHGCIRTRKHSTLSVLLQIPTILAMRRSKCPNTSCEFISASSKAHAVHRSHYPSCEIIHAMESTRWRELLAESIAKNHDFLGVILPCSSESTSAASHNSNVVNEGYSPMDDVDMEDDRDTVQQDKG